MSVYLPIIGGAVLKFYVSPTNIWTANYFVGIAADAPNPVSTQVIPWIAPGPGTVSDLAVQGLARQTTGGTLHLTMLKAAGSVTPSYTATALSAEILNQAGNGQDAVNSFDVELGDMMLVTLDGNWSGGQSVSARWKPRVS